MPDFTFGGFSGRFSSCIFYLFSIVDFSTFVLVHCLSFRPYISKGLNFLLNALVSLSMILVDLSLLGNKIQFFVMKNRIS
jgi:hypothetical protein